MLFVLAGCQRTSERISTEDVIRKPTKRFSGIKRNTIDKNGDFINGISGLASFLKNGGVIFYYTGFDCGTCVQEGINSIKTLEKLGYNARVVAFESNVSQDQIYYDYKNRIWVDQKDFLHASFDFMPTPFFMSLDSGFVIQDLHFPTTGSDPDSLSFFSGLDKN